MNYLKILTCAVVFFIGLNGYAGSHTNFVSTGKPSVKKKMTYADTLANELAGLSEPPVRTTVEARQEQARMGSDSSTIQTTYDAFGNKTESRVFYNDPLLQMIILKTSASGQQEALIYGRGGETRIAPENLNAQILTLGASEIANTVEIYEVPKENEAMLANLNQPPMISNAQPLPLNVEQPITQETAAVVKTEPAPEPVKPAVEESAKVESKAVERENSALKLRAVVQSIETMRLKSSTPKTVAKAN